MTVAAQKMLLHEKPRVAVGLYNGSTHNWYSHSNIKFSATEHAHGRLLSISPITNALSGDSLCVPKCEIVLADGDGSIKALNVTRATGVINIRFGYPDVSFASWKAATFDLASPPKYINGTAIFSCISGAQSVLNSIVSPFTITSDDLATFSKNFSFALDSAIRSGMYAPTGDGVHERFIITVFGTKRSALATHMIGMTLPWIFGTWERENGAVGTAQVAPGTFLFAAVPTSAPGTTYEYPEVWVESRGKWHNLTTAQNIDNKTYYTLGYFTVSRAGETPSSWRIWYVRMDYWRAGSSLSALITAPSPEEAYADLYSQCRLNFPNAATTSGARGDGKIKAGCTPIDILHLISENLQLAVVHFETSAAVRDAMESAGIFSQFILSSPQKLSDIAMYLSKDTGLSVVSNSWYPSVPNKTSLKFLSTLVESPSTEVLNGYSSYPQRIEYKHCYECTREDAEIINEINVEVEGIVTKLTADSTYSAGENRAIANMDRASAYEAMWRLIQISKDNSGVYRFTLRGPLVWAEDDPGDIVRFTDIQTGLIDVPAQIESQTVDLQNMQCDIILRTFGGLTSTNSMVLLDESAQVRVVNAVTAETVAGQDYVNFPGDPGDAPADDWIGRIIELCDDDYQISGRITFGPVNAGGWHLHVLAAFDVSHTFASGTWRVTESYATASAAVKAKSGFLCDETDSLFFDNVSPGKVLPL